MLLPFVSASVQQSICIRDNTHKHFLPTTLCERQMMYNISTNHYPMFFTSLVLFLFVLASTDFGFGFDFDLGLSLHLHLARQPVGERKPG